MQGSIVWVKGVICYLCTKPSDFIVPGRYINKMRKKRVRQRMERLGFVTEFKVSRQ